MYLRPDSVRTSLIRNPKNVEPDWDNPILDFSKYLDTGVIGDPTVASEELGAKLWTEVTKEVASMINHFDKHGA
jgi:creatinine amidohydrolase